MSSSSQTAARVILAAWVAITIAAFARLQHTAPAWLLMLPCAAAIFISLPSMPSRVVLAVRYAAYALLAGVLVLGFQFMAYPILQASTARMLTLAAGYSAASLAGLFLLGRRSWTTAHDVWPASLATLAVGCFSTAPDARALAALAGLAAVAWLAQTAAPVPRPLRTALWLRGTLFALLFAGLAAGIIAFLPPAQDWVEKLLARIAVPQDSMQAFFSTDSSLGDLEELKLSSRVVMRVWTDQPQKLRARVFIAFNGRRWGSAVTTDRIVNGRVARWSATFGLGIAPVAHTSLPTAFAQWMSAVHGQLFDICAPGTSTAVCDDAARPGRLPTFRKTRVVQKPSSNGMLLAPFGTRVLKAPVEHVGLMPFRLFTGLPAELETYALINDRELPQDTLPPEVFQICLRPGTNDPRLRELAARLAAGASGDEDKLGRTVDYLQRECHYSLNPGKFHTDQPVAEFLFEKKQGYCEYFASAAAVLLRLEGVPVRYVTGFNVGPANRMRDHYVVREKDAHAWIEVYLPGKGWVETDPTPPAEYAALTADLNGGAWDEWFETAKVRASELWAQLRALGWKGVLRRLFMAASRAVWVPLAVLLAAAAFWFFRRRPRKLHAARAGAGETGEADELMLLLDANWKRLGCARPASRAPLEHCLALPREKLPAEMIALSRQAVECYYRACFAGDASTKPQIAQITETLRKR